MDLYFSVIKYRIYPIIPALFLIFSILLFQKLFQHNVHMPIYIALKIKDYC